MTIKTESVIVGAGPCGLFQIFELGLLDIRCHVVDSLPLTGGQCAVLYAEKPIYDIPAYPIISGQQLTDVLEEQVKPFDPQLHLGEQVTRLQKREDGRFDLETSKGTRFDSGSVVIAGGLGSFDPRPLRSPGAAQFAGVNLNYKVSDKEQFRDKRVAILGGGDSALDWALELRSIAKSIVLVHRREEFRAQPASVRKLKEICAQPDSGMAYHIGRIGKLYDDGTRLTGLQVIEFTETKDEIEIEFDELLVFYGLSPNLGPIAEWGLEVSRKLIAIDTKDSQTSTPGIFAVGDITEYPGKKKFILCGFHEAAMAAFGVQHYLYPEIKQRVMFTTTSPALHARLGVTGAM